MLLAGNHLQVVLAWGNKKTNAFYEARMPKRYKKPDQNMGGDSTYELEQYIRKKYEQKKWAPKGISARKWLKAFNVSVTPRAPNCVIYIHLLLEHVTWVIVSW